MLVKRAKLLNCPVMSLHLGGEIARTAEDIVSPHDLKILAFLVTGDLVGSELGEILDVRSIREISRLGMIIDSGDDLAERDDIIKIREVLDLNFHLLGMRVKSKRGTKLGKVIDYTVNTENFAVQQLVVQRPIMKSFLDPELLIGRSQVIKVTDDEIIIKDEEDKLLKQTGQEDFIPNFVNPFREQRLSPARKESPDEVGTE